jgi:hypothetical protein
MNHCGAAAPELPADLQAPGPAKASSDRYQHLVTFRGMNISVKDTFFFTASAIQVLFET